jgi:RNA polymerase sigma factor (TIGR02999 family)
MPNEYALKGEGNFPQVEPEAGYWFRCPNFVTDFSKKFAIACRNKKEDTAMETFLDKEMTAKAVTETDVEFNEWFINWEKTNFGNLDKLPLAIQNEIRRLAVLQMSKERRNHTLQPTALINEVYIKLMSAPNFNIEGKSHFIKRIARMMRNILIDYARKRKSSGGMYCDQYLDDVTYLKKEMSVVDNLALDIALEKLEKLDKKLAEIVEMRFFMGLTMSQIADALGVSKSTVERDWHTAKAFLNTELRGVVYDSCPMAKYKESF